MSPLSNCRGETLIRVCAWNWSTSEEQTDGGMNGTLFPSLFLFYINHTQSYQPLLPHPIPSPSMTPTTPTFLLHSSGGVVQRDSRYRRSTRMRRIHQYFYGPSRGPGKGWMGVVGMLWLSCLNAEKEEGHDGLVFFLLFWSHQDRTHLHQMPTANQQTYQTGLFPSLLPTSPPTH